MQLRKYAVIATALAGIAMTPGAARAQDDRLTVHGSINIGYGKTDGLPYFGMTKDGTSEQRAVALQFGYKLGDKDRLVTQFLHRKFGRSPLNQVEPDFFPVWAFYEHKFDNGVGVKLGRTPLPRGIYNEVRFIGTLLPFYRTGSVVYGETLENLDGVVVSKTFNVGAFKIESHAFGGGFDLKYQVPSATGNAVGNSRQENTIGAQAWLTTPIPGVRLGGFVSSFASVPRLTIPKAQRPGRTTSAMYSLDASYEQGFVRGEWTTFDGKGPTSRTNFDAYYVQGGFRPTERFLIAAEYNFGNNRAMLPAPIPAIDIPITKDVGIGFTFKPSASVALKLEGHRNEGYQFDVPVPTVIPPTAPPLVAKLAPASKAFYGIASIAVAF